MGIMLNGVVWRASDSLAHFYKLISVWRIGDRSSKFKATYKYLYWEGSNFWKRLRNAIKTLKWLREKEKDMQGKT